MPSKASHITATDQFCGAGGSTSGAKAAGVDVRMALNHWDLAIETHNTNHPETDHDCTDIHACDPRYYPSTNILITSPECFVAGTLILTGRGLIPIEDVEVGDVVLTHKGRWRRVYWTKISHEDTIKISGQGHTPGIEVTKSHPFYVRRQYQKWDNDKRDYNRRLYDDPIWLEAEKLMSDKYRWSTPIGYEPLPIPRVLGRGMGESDPKFWWLVGRWLGDGTARIRDEHGHELTICCGFHEADGLDKILDYWRPKGSNCRAGYNEIRWRRRNVRTATLFEAGHSGLAEWLVKHFGKLAHGKTLPPWALTMSRDFREQLLAGYVSADGTTNDRYTQINTVSKSLAIGVRLLVESLGYRASLHRYSMDHASNIEGRECNVRDSWAVKWENNKSEREAFAKGIHSWSLIKDIGEGSKSVSVFNIAVEEDESYVADGIVVHNCTNHSLAKGQKRKNLEQYRLFGQKAISAEQERSRATMFDVPRFAEYHNYDIVVVENVVDARRWVMWEPWLMAMHSLGYQHRCCYFNSMHFFPCPQSRDRIYIVFWKKGNKAPDLEFRPISHCPDCNKDVESYQWWKNQDKKWGKYRQQYLYRCSECTAVVEPYYYAAFNCIDWSIPGTRIGDRKKPLAKNTMKRIRYGLDKYGKEPLVITTRYTSGVDCRVKQPHEAPLPTQPGDQCHALANPFLIRTNFQTIRMQQQVKDMGDALPTQATSNMFGLVHPFIFTTEHSKAGDGAYVKSATDPNITQTTRQTKAIVMPFIAEMNRTGKSRSVKEYMSTVLANGNHHMLIGNYSPGWARDLSKPTGSITTTDHHGVVSTPFVVPNYGQSKARPMSESIGSMTSEIKHGIVSHESFAAFLTYYYGSQTLSSLDDSMNTVTTRDRANIVTSAPDINDCTYRMLKPHEIQLAMSFHESYIVLGNSRQKVKQLGNAVTPPVMEWLTDRCVKSLER